MILWIRLCNIPFEDITAGFKREKKIFFNFVEFDVSLSYIYSFKFILQTYICIFFLLFVFHSYTNIILVHVI